MTNPRQSALRGIWRSVRLPLLVITGIVVALLVWSEVVITRGSRPVEHVSAKDAKFDVPPEATDICYNTTPGYEFDNFAIEFSIAEEPFVAWAKSFGGLKLKEIEDPYCIYRYKAFAGDDRANAEATITDGLCGEAFPGSAKGMHLAYDRHVKRAYYWLSSRGQVPIPSPAKLPEL
jgi:hypothetical protein